MLLFIISGILLAKFKGFKVHHLTKHIDLYPLFAVQAVYIFFQINALFGNYTFVKYARPIQMAFILSLLLPILKNKLYIQAVIGSALVFIGSLLNNIVISANNGHMPVYPTLSNITGYTNDSIFNQGIDSLHILMTPDTKLNFLADYIDTGFSVMSIGDLINHSFITIIVYFTLKKLHLETQGEVNK